jgi:hypothetical protein
MTCPPLELWLEALDESRDAPEAAHGDCATCAATRAEARGLLDALAAGVPVSPVGEEEFLARVLAAIPAVAPPRAASRRILAWWVAAGGPVAAAAAVLLVLATRPPPRDDGPVARGARVAAKRWCEVALARDQGLSFLAEGARVPQGAALAFRVLHEGPDDAWLGIFAITDRGRVAWYHPAFESAEADPVTLRVAPAPEPQLLPQRVALPLGEGKVRIVCWKADREWRVRKADAIVERVAGAASEPARLERVPGLGGVQEGVELWFGADR